MGKTLRISNRVGKMGVSAIHEMTRLSKEIDDVAFLSWAKPTSDTPGHIKQAAIQAIEGGLVGGYSAPLGLPALCEAIAEKLRRDNRIDARASEVLVTVGAIEGLAAAVMAVVDPGDEVILPSPTYATHIRQVLLASGKPVIAPSDEETGFPLDLDGIEKAITSKTRAIMFATPANPTGAVFSEEQLRHVARLALEHDLAVITDEAYEYFVFDGHTHFSIASIPEMKGHAISCFTFTKTYAMTGWRVGYLHADEALIPQIRKAHIPFAICAPVVSQYAALAALQGPQDCIEEFRAKYLAARDLMCSRLDGLSSFFDYQKPGGSYLMFPRILVPEGQADSVSFCKKLLREARVSTTPGAAFGPTGEGHLRMSFCVPLDTVNKAFDRLERYFQ
ncbi:MAG: pyridoxal phosphate-dependent aminotransferase [Candidatus Hydrogenedentes bacterium]|nr:pyridoxal phosphate-dependent aminotransferase [Candidatus Hydrogenedentota bacterium]